MKKCYKCNIEKPTSEFHKSKNSEDGLSYQCKACKKAQYEVDRSALIEYKKWWREEGKREQKKKRQIESKERKREQNKKWCEANKKKIAEKAKKRYQENREAYLENKKKWYEANKEQVAEYAKKHYQENKEVYIERQKRYNQDNKERINERQRKRYAENREAMREKQKKYRASNRERIAEQNKKYREENKELIAEIVKKYREANREAIREKAKKRRKQMREDPRFKLKENLRSRTYAAFKAKGWSMPLSVEEIIGGYNKAMAHIEMRLRPGMSWSNYGEWQLDHIVPLGSAEDDIHLIELCCYLNIQPLWRKENIAKKNKILTCRVEYKHEVIELT